MPSFTPALTTVIVFTLGSDISLFLADISYLTNSRKNHTTFLPFWHLCRLSVSSDFKFLAYKYFDFAWSDPSCIADTLILMSHSTAQHPISSFGTPCLSPSG